jgi:hypothetical protein
MNKGKCAWGFRVCERRQDYDKDYGIAYGIAYGRNASITARRCADPNAACDDERCGGRSQWMEGSIASAHVCLDDLGKDAVSVWGEQ